MSQQPIDQTLFHDFFREEAVGVLGLNQQKTGKELTFQPDKELPVLPVSSSAPEKEMNAYWRLLRTFFRTGKGGGLPLEEDRPVAFPALLSPYLDLPSWPGPYPLWVAGAEGEQADEPFLPLMDLIGQALDSFAPAAGAAKILRDNLPRLERLIRKKLAFADILYEAHPLVRDALEELVLELNVSGNEGETFKKEVEALKKALPKSGVLIPGGSRAPFHFLAVILPIYRKKHQTQIKEQIQELSNRLQEILAVEKEKKPEAHAPGHLQDTLDFAGSFLNFEELSAVMPLSGSGAMPAERFHRIEKILKTLEEAGPQLLDTDADICLTSALAGQESFLEDTPQRIRIHRLAPNDFCREAARRFDEQMAGYVRIFAALRLGQLEVAGKYRPAMHLDFFNHFNWYSFSEAEWLACPPFILLTDDVSLLRHSLSGLSDLLASDRPVKLLVFRREMLPAEPAGQVFRQELGALAMAHRNPYILQSSDIDPLFILHGLKTGLPAFSPALFYLFSPLEEPGREPEQHLTASAAVEGRAFPGFIYDSRKGPWGSRFFIRNNPQAAADWPEHRLVFKKKAGQSEEMAMPFTFADFAGLNPRFNDQFQLVPPEYWNENLVLLADYLALDPKENFAKVPFIWMLDQQRMLHKAAVSWAMVRFCRERLDFWRYLQENAGIQSYHVELAKEKLLRESEQKFAEEKTALQQAHQKELEKVKEETARLAMERLAATLLEMDGGVDLFAESTAASIKAVPSAPAVQAEATASASKKDLAAPASLPEKETKPATPMAAEAWVDTPLCTSCNECIDTNKRIFQYNADKQAFVADPKGGPFADIVKAAENCPVRIIHPGTPQDPKEAGLEDLIKRAAPFN